MTTITRYLTTITSVGVGTFIVSSLLSLILNRTNVSFANGSNGRDCITVSNGDYIY